MLTECVDEKLLSFRIRIPISPFVFLIHLKYEPLDIEFGGWRILVV